MLILSNGLTKVADEGFLKVANSLVERIKRTAPDTTVVSYERHSPLTDIYVNVNKLMLGGGLTRLLKQRRDTVLYIPFPAKMLATAARIFVLSRFTRRLRVLPVMNGHIGRSAKLLLRLSGAEFLLLSDESAALYRSFLPNKRVGRLKAGVDTSRFAPVSPQQAAELKGQYGLDPDRPVVLHVGHLNEGRNVGVLERIDEKYQVLLITSTLTKGEQDEALRRRLLSRENITLIDSYLPNIEQAYQLCDVYLFPTVEQGHCIDVPLSCLEAASCNKPVITTEYGEMKQFAGKSGFSFISSFDSAAVNGAIERALRLQDAGTRQQVLEYDWDRSIEMLTATDNN